jgi:cytochrome P450/NADPH-cytochrome P450 reductase
LIDATLEKKGAKRLLERGEADAGGDMFSQSFEEWEEKLWETLAMVCLATARFVTAFDECVAGV